MDGLIDEVRIYNRSLSASEVSALYAYTGGPAPTPDTQAPSTPTILSATAQSSSQINLSWTQSTDNVGVTGYRVERCQGSGCTNLIQIATPLTTSYNDTGLSANTTYRYQVRAVDAAGNLSAYSSIVNGTTQAASTGGAPARSIPYTDPACSGSGVFFCEDFEGRDLSLDGNSGNNANKYWNNPALQSTDLYWAIGGSHQRSTIPLVGFNQSTNHVYRITKSEAYTDIVTGFNTAKGPGTIGAWLRPEILGTGAQEWYMRMQVYFHTNHTWPADYDYKVFFALPRTFIDPPSAAYEAGMYFHQDYWCSTAGNFNDVLIIRYSSGFRQFPSQNEYCPPLSPGLDANGINPRVFRQGVGIRSSIIPSCLPILLEY